MAILAGARTINKVEVVVGGEANLFLRKRQSSVKNASVSRALYKLNPFGRLVNIQRKDRKTKGRQILGNDSLSV